MKIICFHKRILSSYKMPAIIINGYFVTLTLITLSLPLYQYFISKLTIDSSPAMKFYPQLALLIAFCSTFFYMLSRWVNDKPKNPTKPVDIVMKLLNECGQKDYIGENVSQIEHSLQCAALAIQKIQEHPELFAEMANSIINPADSAVNDNHDQGNGENNADDENGESNETEDDKCEENNETEDIENENEDENIGSETEDKTKED